MIHFYLRCSYYKIKIILRKNCKNEVIRVYTCLSESNRVYTNMSRLIFEHIIVFTNGSFIIQTETESSLTKPNRVEFTSGRAHLTPLAVNEPILSKYPLFELGSFTFSTSLRRAKKLGSSSARHGDECLIEYLARLNSIKVKKK